MAETLNTATNTCVAPTCTAPQVNDAITGACITPITPPVTPPTDNTGLAKDSTLLGVQNSVNAVKSSVDGVKTSVESLASTVAKDSTLKSILDWMTSLPSLGSASDPDAIPKISAPTSFAPTSWGSGSCPADEVATLRSGGQSLSFSYQPLCNLASGIAPVLIAISFLLAGYIVLGSVKD
ncbi:virulence factor TspB C-terminal domain-related protein [Methylobacter sp.]|uniref:virulence factor TspB C-terminal domain-related protein n=1 Tax=Methylobacter sp. TaxID=2051955 RepID=UPI002FDD740A